jgi:alkylation response protein AidB-like acyl-CoA dehydrogenase
VDFEPSEDQAAILAGLEQLIAAHAVDAPKEPVFAAYADQLDRALADAGYLDIAREEGFGPLEAALIVERLARLPRSVEAAASALVAPVAGLPRGLRPVALASRVDAPARYLSRARALIVVGEDDALVLDLDGARVTPVETLFAYDYGRLADAADLPARPLSPQQAAMVRRRWRLVIAVEAAGLMDSALALVLDHVKTRVAFGRPLGAFQAIQHRLAMAAETVQSTKWLAFRAAWSDNEEDCALAAAFAQDRIPAFTYDLHQFSGAMGLTLEFPLHHWTYRLRALLGELGGSSPQARAAALAAWPDAA